MTGSGRGDRETAAVEAARLKLPAAWRHDGTTDEGLALTRVMLAAARPHLRAEVAAEIVQHLRAPYPDAGAALGFQWAADFIEQRFVSVRPDNEEAK